MNAKGIDLVECPRDAMQGWPHQIPTQKKVEYLQQLLAVGFHTLDFGSFVSPKAIPQMADTKEVLAQLDLSDTKTSLLAIVANLRGAKEAANYPGIRYIGFPFSISETFQQRNTNSSVEESFLTVKAIRDICSSEGKELVVYLSMGFGNPYGDAYSAQTVIDWAGKMVEEGVRILSVADTVGLATPQQIESVMKKVIPSYPGTAIGVHLHSAPHHRAEKLEAALLAGCIRFDSAIKGIGGCPMAGDALVGNMDTEILISHFRNKGIDIGVDDAALSKASSLAGSVFI